MRAFMAVAVEKYAFEYRVRLQSLKNIGIFGHSGCRTVQKNIVFSLTQISTSEKRRIKLQGKEKKGNRGKVWAWKSPKFVAFGRGRRKGKKHDLWFCYGVLYSSKNVVWDPGGREFAGKYGKNRTTKLQKDITKGLSSLDSQGKKISSGNKKKFKLKEIYSWRVLDQNLNGENETPSVGQKVR